jgi:hypothetical protein
MSELLISTRELCDLAGVTYRQADYWTRQGYLVIAGPPAGSGNPRRYTLVEVRVADALRQVVGAGCRAPHAVAETIRTLPPGTSWPILLDGDGYLVTELDSARYVVQPLDALAPA